MLFLCLYFSCTLPFVIKSRWAHSIASTSPATARDRSNKHGLLEKRRSIDEQVMLFPGGHCAVGHAEWALITGISGKRGCWSACQCFIRSWAVGKVRCPHAPPALPRA